MGMAPFNMSIPHGFGTDGKSPSGYFNHGCRCDDCREAYRIYMRQWRSEHPGYRDKYLRDRALVGVRCQSCGWKSRRSERDGFDAAEEKPCPHCGGQVSV